MSSAFSDPAAQIKQYASEQGFDACGIAAAAPVDEETRQRFRKWLDNGCQAGMDYMLRHTEQRYDPRLLVEGARSMIVTALNYYPFLRQPASHPQFSYYAYGQDYHKVIKEKLYRIMARIKEIDPLSENRVFVDTAPLAERYWAVQAGLGFIGRNSQLILPGKGSYFFIGIIVSTLDLTPDTPATGSCGNCRACEERCPAKALGGENGLDARLCLSYQTIENRGELSDEAISCLDNRIYGCDTCQQVCPWNREATPNSTPEFAPNEDFLSLDCERLQQLSEEGFRRIFKESAVKRAKYAGLMRNLKAIKK